MSDLLFKYLLRLFYKISQPKTRNLVGFSPLKCVFFKNTMNLNFLPWRNAYLIVTFYVSAVCTLMAFIAIPKTSLKALKESVVPAVSIFTIAGVLLMIY